MVVAHTKQYYYMYFMCLHEVHTDTKEVRESSNSPDETGSIMDIVKGITENVSEVTRLGGWGTTARLHLLSWHVRMTVAVHARLQEDLLTKCMRVGVPCHQVLKGTNGGTPRSWCASHQLGTSSRRTP